MGQNMKKLILLALTGTLMLGMGAGAMAQAVYSPPAASATQSTQVVYASRAGCVSDASVALGSTNFGATDNAAALQAVLNKAQNGPLMLVLDGQYGIGSTLIIYSNTTIVGLNRSCGLIQKSGMNAPALMNANLKWSEQTTATAVPATGLDSNITLDNFTLNGNGANQIKWAGYNNSTASSNKSTWVSTTNNGKTVYFAPGGYTTPLRLWGVNHVTLSNMLLYSPRTYMTHFADFYDVTVRNCTINVGASGYNYDGFHFNGPGRGLYASGLTVTTADDSFALNADDCIAQPDNQSPSPGVSTAVQMGFGPITDVSLDGLNFADSLYGIRLLSGGSRIDRVRLADIHGVTSGQGFLCDNYDENTSYILNSGAGNVGSVTVDGADFASTPYSSYKPAYFYISCKADSLRFRNINRSNFSTSTLVPTFLFGPNSNVDSAMFDGLTSTDPTGGAVPIIAVRGAISLLTVRNASQRITSSGTATITQPLIQLDASASAVGRLVLSGISADRVSSVVNVTAGTMGPVSATGVAHSNANGGNTFNFNSNVVPKLTASNYDGLNLFGTSGTGGLTATTGDAFTLTALASGTLGGVGGNGQATITASGSSGGMAPRTTSLYRSATTGFTPPGAGTLVSGTSPWTDTGLTNGTTYFYRGLVTDSSSTPQTVLTPQISVVPSITSAQSTFVAPNGTDLAAYTPNVGSNWREDTGTWAINSNVASGTGTVSGNQWVASVPVSGLTKLTIGINFVGGVQTYTNSMQIYPRMTDPNNCIVLNIANSSMSCYSGSGGTFTAVASSIAIPTTNGAHTIVITVSGSNYTVAEDGGTPVAFSTSAQSSALRAGIGQTQSATPLGSFSSFLAQ